MIAKTSPTFTIITVTYNSVHTLERTILSVLNQSFTDFEYIIIDGGSQDGTLDMIKRYSDYITYWISEPDFGIYDAMNKGIKQANGEFIGFLNSDDWYEVDTLKDVFQNIDNDVDVLYGNIIYENDQLKVSYPTFNTETMNDHMTLFHPSTFVRTRIYKLFKFNLKYKIVSDWDFFIRIVQTRKYNFKYINKVLSHFSVDGISQKISIKLLVEKNKLRFKYSDHRYRLLFKDLIVYMLLKMNLLKIYHFIKYKTNIY